MLVAVCPAENMSCIFWTRANSIISKTYSETGEECEQTLLHVTGKVLRDDNLAFVGAIMRLILFEIYKKGSAAPPNHYPLPHMLSVL